MNILLCGSGVIGSYVANVLCEHGHYVKLLDQRSCERSGIADPYPQKIEKPSVNYPVLVDSIDPEVHYDALIVDMPKKELRCFLEELADSDTDLIILLDCDESAQSLAKLIKGLSSNNKSVLSVSSDASGLWDCDKVDFIRFADIPLWDMEKGDPRTVQTRKLLRELFLEEKER